MIIHKKILPNLFMQTKINNFLKTNDLMQLAKYLLFETHIVVNNNSYRMLEIELYVYNDKHNDIFTHCHTEQKNMLTWYFHQMSEKENSYKGGTYKGMDITCGIDDGYGGILIRSIMNETDNTVIEGPCKVVNEILEKTGQDCIKNLVVDKLNNDKSCLNNDLLKLEEKCYDNVDMFYAPRIGLSMKGSNIEEKKIWVNQNYRFIVFKDKIKKEKTKMIKM